MKKKIFALTLSTLLLSLGAVGLGGDYRIVAEAVALLGGFAALMLAYIGSILS